MNPDLRAKLCNFADALIDQRAARVLVPPYGESSGYWFGGGNMVLGENGELVLCGRYRNFGDSRTGVGSGERGLELAVFSSYGFDRPFHKQASYSKSDLSVDGAEVVSIEGVSLFISEDGPELYISTEKNVEYPMGYRDFQKPGTGVWSIDCVKGDRLMPVASSKELGTLHIKDPVVFKRNSGEIMLIYCSHPHTWSSSNSGFAIKVNQHAEFARASDTFFPRGAIWDVACARITDRLKVPRLGAFRSERPCSLYFYDGAECLRELDENPSASRRPRGYSCEELGGLAFGYDDEFPQIHRLSVEAPMFVSPYGTGCSRYVSTLVAKGQVMATWQQSQDNQSQPLVGHALSLEKVEELLS